MGDGEIVSPEVGGLRVSVDERRVGVVDDLAVTVVLHHDDEDVVEMGNPPWHGAFGGRRVVRDCGCQQAERNSGGLHEESFRVCRVVPRGAALTLASNPWVAATLLRLADRGRHESATSER